MMDSNMLLLLDISNGIILVFGTQTVGYLIKSTYFYPITINNPVFATTQNTEEGTYLTNYNNYVWGITSTSLKHVVCDHGNNSKVDILVIGY